MEETGDEFQALAKKIGENLGGEQITLLRTLVRSIKKKPYECARCNRRFNIANPKPNGIYKCVHCHAVMSPASAQPTSTLRSEEAELVLDEAVPPEVQEALKSPDNILGKYVLTAKLGEGGMGTVWRAFDVELGRFVALKFIKSRQAEELKAEAKTLASLEHKNIARIYEIGNAKGQCFIAIQLVNGTTLASLGPGPSTGSGRAGGDGLEAKLAIMIDACEAVDYAHQRGINHRDIKPENMMIDQDGNVFVMDFGLAVRGEVTEVAGTPGYMAPELTGSAQGDVFSLAATLLTLLAGRNPLGISAGEDVEAVIARIRTGEHIPVPDNIPVELTAIVEKGMAADPKNRYLTAREMGRDIRNYLDGFPVSAFSSAVGYKARKLFARNKRIAAVSVLALVVAAAAGFFGYRKMQERDAQKNLRVEEEGRRKAEESRRIEVEEKKRKLEKAQEIMLEGRRIIDESSVFLYKKFDDDRLGKEMDNWHKKVIAGIRKIEESFQFCETAEAHYLIGRGYSFIGRLPQAEAGYNRSLALNPKHSGALLGRARVSIQQGLSFWLSERPEMRDLSKDLIAKAMSDTSAAKGSAEAGDAAERAMAAGYDKLMKGAYEEAEEYSQAELKKTADEEFLLIIGIARLRRSDETGALETLNRALDKRPNFALAFVCRGAVQHAMGHDKQAIEDYSKALVIDPEYAWAYTNRGLILEGSGDSKGAIEDYRKAIDIDPNYIMAHIHRGRLRNYSGDYKGAIVDYDRVIELNPNFEWAYMDRCSAKYRLGDIEGARKDCETAIKLSPDHGWNYFNRAAMKENEGDHEGAIEDYKKGISLEPQWAGMYLTCGIIESHLGRYADAIDHFTKSLKIDPKQPPAYFHRATAKTGLEDYEGAIRDCTTAIDLGVKSAQVYSMRSAAKNNRGDYQGAIEDAGQALELDPKFPHALYCRAWAKVKLSDYRGAIEDCTRALDSSPNFPDAYEVRATSYAALKEYGKAKADYQKALDTAPANWPNRALAQKQLEALKKKSGGDE